jgi:hypothetical protein
VPIEVLNLEFLNHNAVRSYPFTVEATRLDTTGVFTIPEDFIVGLVLSVHAAHNVDPSKFHVYKIGAFASGYSITIGYDSEPVATAIIASASHTKNTTYAFGGLGNFLDATGHVTIGDLGNIGNQPAGQFEFSVAAALLEVDVIRPNIRGVTALTVQNGDTVGDRIYGDVRLVAGKNVRFTTSISAGVTLLTIDAIEGVGLTEACVCADDIAATPIYTVNGIGPTPDGDLRILGGDCIGVSEVENGIKLEDSCAKPCCGCTELAAITDAMETFAQQLATLETFITGLEGVHSGTQNNLLASKLGDRGCLSCDEATE